MRFPAPRHTGARPVLSALALATGVATFVAAPAAVGADYRVDRHFSDPRIVESSGIARSTFDRRVIWTHNDSGDTNRVFAVSKRGKTRAVLTLNGAYNWDWEDISTGPNHTLWIGDIGANKLERPFIRLFRFKEPRKLRTSTVQATRYDIVYPDGRHNAEGMLVHPTTGRVYVVTKGQNGGAVYVAPKRLSTTKENRLTKVASAPKMISAATFSPNGRTIVLASYGKAYLYKKFGGNARTVAKPSGESVELMRRGVLLTGSEGKQSRVYRISTR